MICDKDRWIRYTIDSRIVKRLSFHIADIRRQGVAAAVAIFADDDPTGVDVLLVAIILVGGGIRRAGRIASIAGKVHALPVHRRILPTEGTVKSLLQDLFHHLDVRSVP